MSFHQIEQSSENGRETLRESANRHVSAVELKGAILWRGSCDTLVRRVRNRARLTSVSPALFRLEASLKSLLQRFTGLGCWRPEVLCGLFVICRFLIPQDPRMTHCLPNYRKTVTLNRFERVSGFPIWTTSWIRPIGLPFWGASIVRSGTFFARLWGSRCLVVDPPTRPRMDSEFYFRLFLILY